MDPVAWADAVALSYAERLVFFDLILRREPVTGVRRWAQQLGVNDRTAKAALDTLIRHGVATTQTPGPGMPTYVRLTTPPRVEAHNPTSAETHNPYTFSAPPPGAPEPHPPSEIPNPASEITYLQPSLRKEKEASFLTEVLQQLNYEQRTEVLAAHNAGGRVTFERLLEELSARHDADTVIRVLLTTLPSTGVKSVLGYLIARSRHLLDNPGALTSSPVPDVASLSITSYNEEAEIEAAVSFARLQAHSMRSPHEAVSLLRGIELEFGHSPRALDAAKEAFNQAIAQ